MRSWKSGDFIRCDAALAAPTVETLPDGYVKGIASSPSTDLYGHQVRAHAFDASIRRKVL